jgi:hypothetical protein
MKMRSLEIQLVEMAYLNAELSIDHFLYRLFLLSERSHTTTINVCCIGSTFRDENMYIFFIIEVKGCMQHGLIFAIARIAIDW